MIMISIDHNEKSPPNVPGPSEENQHTESRDLVIPRLLELHGGKMFRVALRLCGNYEDAQDLVQDTFLQAYTNWDQFEGRSNVTTWLYTIAARICQRMHRLRAGEPKKMESLDELLPFGETLMTTLPDDIDDPSMVAIRKDLSMRVEEAISTLPVHFRIPLIFKDVLDLPIVEIAKVLDVKPETVKTRIYRSRLLVRKKLIRGLPAHKAPPPAYSKQICLDLLRTKQEALDRGVSFPVRNEVICERCLAVFASMDLGQDICRELSSGNLPPELRKTILGQTSEH